MKSFATFLVFLVLLAGCREKKKPEKDTSRYFPILSFLQGQARQLDSSLARFTKIETVGNRSDTQIISREEVRKYAEDFLSIPNIKKPSVGNNYDNTNIYDSVLGLVIITYQANDEDVEVNRQEIHIIPTFDGNDKVKTIYIDKAEEKGKDIIEKKMIWEVGKYFNIRTILHKDDAPEPEISNLRIFWQDFTKN